MKDVGSGLKEDRRNFQKLLSMVINKEVSKSSLHIQTDWQDLDLRSWRNSLGVMERK